MRTLRKAALRPGTAGDPIPDVFPALRTLGVKPRRGAVTMIAAESKSLKTFLALYWVSRTGLRTEYFSADSDDVTMRERAAAMVSQVTQDEVRRDPAAYMPNLAQLDFMRWVFESDPTYVDLVEETEAYAEAYGDFPEIIVVDNLANVVGEDENEYGSMRDTTKALHRLTRITGAAVFVLHHMREDGTRPYEHPRPKRELKGKVSDFPEMILSVRHDKERSVLQIAPVANRHGKDDPSGRTYAELFVNPDYATFYNSEYDMRSGIAA